MHLECVVHPAERAVVLSICVNARLVCRPYAVDRDVVWVPPPRMPVRASGYAAIGNANALPWVNDKGRALYQRFLSAPLPRAFAVATTGQAAIAQGGYDPMSRALRKCREAGLTCRPYAIDGTVVWRPGS